MLLCRKQDKWTRQQIKNNKDDPFWRHAGYLIAQLDGLYMGTKEWAKRQKKTVRNITWYLNNLEEERKKENLDYFFIIKKSPTGSVLLFPIYETFKEFILQLPM